MIRWVKRVVVAVIVLGLAAAAAGWYLNRAGGQATSFRTAGVTRGDLVVAIRATGTLEPEEVIDVGAQVAGQIMAFGQDEAGKTVDYTSQVQEGTILARIDDTVYVAALAEAQAQVQSAQAGLQRAQADIGQMEAKLHQAQRDWERAQRLGPSEALAATSYDAYQAAYETAKANLAVGQAAILQAQAALAQAQAGYDRAQRNLSYCTIKSPVKGVIIDRRVNIGQTVVASLNAPSLFLIAKDLTRMQVWVAVNEADIGRIKTGLPVSFTVDAFPEETFRGMVSKVRLNASMTQNVVTYTVEITTDNSSGKLLPYLTANVQFELDKRENVLLAPNAALRWKPSAEQIAPAFGQESAEAASQPAGGGAAASAGRGEASGRQTRGEGRRAVVWALDGQYVRPIRVRTGLTDGTMTVVEADDLTEGVQLVTGVQSGAAAASSDTNNPFVTRFPSRRRGAPGTPGTPGSPGTSGAPGAPGSPASPGR